MIVFKINEIELGKSSTEVDLSEFPLELKEVSLLNGLLSVQIDRTHDQISISFQVEAELGLICDRSLRSFTSVISSEFTVLFSVDASAIEEGLNSTIKPLNFSKNKIDITSEVRDSILLNIPIKKLHPDYFDENGEEIDFHFQTDEESDEDHIDPRWQKLKSLKNN